MSDKEDNTKRITLRYTKSKLMKISDKDKNP